MRKILKWLAAALAVVIVSSGLAYGGLRLSDGPKEFFPWFTISLGGPFRSGELNPSPSDWSFIKEYEVVEFQTLQPNTSRTVWVSVVDGRFFIVSGYMNSTIGKLWKQWPSYMEQDNRVIIRVDGKLYEQRLERILDGPDIVPVMTEISRKYGSGAPGSNVAVTGGYVWMFEVLPR